MDKKKELQFNLNNFFMSISFLFDFVEKDINQTPLNHSKRVTYIVLKLAHYFHMNNEDLSDLCSYALAHNIGLFNAKVDTKEYCELSQKYISNFEFLNKKENILKYQLEFYNGSGLYGLKQKDIPLFSQLIGFASFIDRKFFVENVSSINKDTIIEFLKDANNKLFSFEIIDAFLNESKRVSFWLDLQNENEMLMYIFSNLRDYTKIYTYEKILELTKTFTHMINSDTKILDYTKKMCEFYEFEYKDMYSFLIAISLKDIGKLAISHTILEKKEKLEPHEFEELKCYPYYSKKALSNIVGFEMIANQVGKVQERLSGCGYPNSFNAKDMSLKDRLLACLNVYYALRSDRVYKDGLRHDEAIKMMIGMSEIKYLDKNVVSDMGNALK